MTNPTPQNDPRHLLRKTAIAALTLATLSVGPQVSAQEPRTVVDGAGISVAVPRNPQTISVLDPLTSLEALLSLGVAPAQIGQRSFIASAGYLDDPLEQWPWLEQALADLGAEPLRMVADEVDLEAVASAEPDLIIGMPSWLDGTREQLERLAPVIATPSSASVREGIALLGQVLGLEDRAAAVIADWDRRISTELAGLAPDGATIAVIRTDEVGTFSAMSNPSYGPIALMLQAGFELAPEIVALPLNADGSYASLSLERLDILAGADVLVVLGFSPEPTAAFLANPLMQSVPAIAEGRVLVIEQGAGAQAIAIMSPLNFDVVQPFAAKAADLAAQAD